MNTMILASVTLLLVPASLAPIAVPQSGAIPFDGAITISGAWALYPMVVRWSEEFRMVHPGVTFDISAGGAGKGMADVLGGMVDIGMVSRDVYPEEVARGAFSVAVTRDAVLPTVNVANPVLPDLIERALGKEDLKALWIDGTSDTWGALVGDPDLTHGINLYTRSDACGAAQTWAKFLGYKQEDLRGIGVYGDPGVAMSVGRDPNGLGYNNLNYAYDPDTGASIPGIVVLPIDVNGNGRIDPTEGPYGTKHEAVKAVGEGWYPSPPARNLNLVTLGRPTGQTKVFVTWVLTAGQQFVQETGYVPLSEELLEQQLKNLL